VPDRFAFLCIEVIKMSIDAACAEFVELVQHARGELDRNSAAKLDEHLTDCRSCLDLYIERVKPPLAPDIPFCHVVREIGRGRFGVVYKAWWLKDKPQRVALKVLGCAGDMEKSRFVREIAVLSKIDSPWIVKCHESGTVGNSTYFMMDYVEGVHLDEYVHSVASDLDAKLSVFERVCRAVADAHAAGVVHRDLKPRNIVVDDEGQPHILDFGICSLEPADWGSSTRRTITQTGDVIGTLRYMSPEQAWGGVAGAVGEPSDIWSLGVMLYEIVTNGGYPYALRDTPDKPSHEALLERIRKELPRRPRLSAIPRGRDLEILLERCLAWEPASRIESAALLAADVEQYRAGRAITTKPFGLWHRAKRLAVGAAVRSRWLFSAGFIAAVGITVSFAALWFNVGWLVSGRSYQGASGSGGMLDSAASAHDSILVVGVFDDTADAIVRFAAEKQIQGVAADVTSWRSVHGHLMERLASARPRALVWDYYFRTPQPGDAQLVAGAKRLEDANVPVVFAALTYREDGTPDLSPGLAESLSDRLRHGAIVARDMVDRPGEFIIAIQRPNAVVVPSLALATLVAVLHPDTRLNPAWTGRNTPIELLYEIKPGTYLRERDLLQPTRVVRVDHGEYGVQPGDVVGSLAFPLDRPEAWEQRTVPYQTMLACSDSELRDRTANKLVIVGDLRLPRPGFQSDRHRVKYGLSTINSVPGCYLLGDAVAGLLDRRYLQLAFPLLLKTFLFVLLAALVGSLLPIGVARLSMFLQLRPRRRLWATLLVLAAVSFCLMLGTRDYAAVHVGMAGFSLLAPMAGSLWVEAARNRYRLLDRNREAIESLRLPPSDAIKLAT